MNLSDLLSTALDDDPKSGLDDIFSEEPVPLDVFVRDKKFMGSPALSPVQFETVRHAERVYFPELYPLMGQHFHPYWAEPVRMVNFINLQWGKGSQDGNSKHYNARTGQWVKLIDWNQQDEVAAAYKEDGKVKTFTGTKAFKEGHGRMFKVTTAKGFENIVWEGHRYLTWSKTHSKNGDRIPGWHAAQRRGITAEWRRLWDMQVGDPIAVSQSVPEPTEPAFMPDHEVEMMGLFLGDGCMPKGGSFSMTCGDAANITRARIEQVMLAFSGIKVTQSLDTSGGSKRWHMRASYGAKNPIIDFIRGNDLYALKADSKFVPDNFFRLNNRQLALFVSRLIDTDGWISFSNTPEIGYGTISKQLAEDVHCLFLRLGVLAELKTKTTKYKGEPYTSYQVRVRDRESLLQLASQLTLLDKEQSRLELLQWCADNKQEKSGKAKHGDFLWDRIVTIEYLYDSDYWTISVDGPASYIGQYGINHHNSGKGHVCRTISIRVAYLLLCLRSPQEYFGMPAQDSIHLLNVAMNAQQAQRAFFDPVEKLVGTSPWFRDKANPTRGAIVYAKNVEAISGHSEAESQEGLNLLLGVADEIDGFKSKEEVRGNTTGRIPVNTVEGILDMMRTSSSTRFPRTFKNVRISYPRYLGSAIQRLTAQSREDVEKKGEKSRHYVSGPLPTWVVNPNFNQFKLVKVEGTDELIPEIYIDDYEEDAAMAKAKYECKPSKASNPYFRNEFLVRSSFTPVTHQPVEVIYYKQGNSWEVRYEFSEDFKPIKGAQYAMHGDLAVTGDRAGIAMAHVVRKEEFESNVTLEDGSVTAIREMRPIVKVDFVFSYESAKGENPPREIQIRWARELAYELKKRGFRIKRFTFDGFESRDSMQILERSGIESKKVSTDRSNEPWRNLMDVMYDGRMIAKHRELLIDELLGLTILPNGKIDHPRLGSKDEADALACAVFGAVEQGGRENSSGDTAFYAPAQFFMGPKVDLPQGMTHALLRQEEF